MEFDLSKHISTFPETEIVLIAKTHPEIIFKRNMVVNFNLMKHQIFYIDSKLF